MSSDYDPSAPHPGENQVTMQYAAAEVSKAYEAARNELDLFLEMIQRVDPPPDQKSNDLEALERWKRNVVSDLLRMTKRIKIGKRYLKARDQAFRYQAERVRTSDRIDRLRMWNRQKKAEVVAAECQGGQPAQRAAQRDFQHEKRVILKCYDLEELWYKALRREKATKKQREHEDLSSGCETEIMEDA